MKALYGAATMRKPRTWFNAWRIYPFYGPVMLWEDVAPPSAAEENVPAS